MPNSCCKRDDVDVAEIQKVGRGSVVFKFLFDNLELNFVVVRISTGDVVHGDHDALRIGLFGDRHPQIVSESCDAAFARQIVTDESDLQ